MISTRKLEKLGYTPGKEVAFSNCLKIKPWTKLLSDDVTIVVEETYVKDDDEPNYPSKPEFYLSFQVMNLPEDIRIRSGSTLIVFEETIKRILEEAKP